MSSLQYYYLRIKEGMIIVNFIKIVFLTLLRSFLVVFITCYKKSKNNLFKILNKCSLEPENRLVYND